MTSRVVRLNEDEQQFLESLMLYNMHSDRDYGELPPRLFNKIKRTATQPMNLNEQTRPNV